VSQLLIGMMQHTFEDLFISVTLNNRQQSRTVKLLAATKLVPLPTLKSKVLGPTLSALTGFFIDCVSFPETQS
jgi:hypothetical protein